MDAEITLITALDDYNDQRRTIFAEREAITQHEYVAAGQKDIKPAHKFIVWAFEYEGETDIEYNGKSYTVYRTFEKGDKVELYAEERGGRR